MENDEKLSNSIIEADKDPKLLFKQLDQSLDSLRELEGILSEIDNLKFGIDNCNNYIKSFISDWLHNALSVAWNLKIIFLVIFYIVLLLCKTKDGIQWFTFYDNAIAKFLTAVKFTSFNTWAEAQKNFWSVISFFITVIVLVIMYLGVPVFCILYPIILLLTMPFIVYRYFQAKRTMVNNQHRLDEVTEKIEPTYFKIKDIVDQIPEDYQNSDAIGYIVNEYNSHRISNFHQGIESYNLHLKHMKTINNLDNE